ncbi:hypothetical protein [Cohnella mopanensis]|uniref:hypothetical protein n=1 Tax=Cohnella mopanensis TaxID=2911966 RepID=UPI001EF93EF3|nr:hypothetical protein [Cohnella mopanensis]
MKRELLQKISHLQIALDELKDVWDRLDWSRVPDEVTENYPFHKDLGELSDTIKHWMETIKKS